MTSENSIRLKSGHYMPMLGLGTWMLSGRTCTDIVRKALEMGYKHIDTADRYNNHAYVAEGMKGFDRGDIFLTTKVWRTDISRDDIVKSCDRFLSELGTDYLDLLLVHWPNDDIPITETMNAMGELVHSGKVRSIGVSNFNEGRLGEAVTASDVPIDANQVEFHAHLYQSELLGYCSRNGVALTAYCPLGRGGLISDPVISDIAKNVGRTPAQVALRWLVQHGIAVIPKSTSPAHLRDNMDIFSWKLPAAGMSRIDAMGAKNRIVDPAFSDEPFFS